VVVRLELELEVEAELEGGSLEHRLVGSGSLCNVPGCSSRDGGSVRCAVAVAAAAAEGRSMHLEIRKASRGSAKLTAARGVAADQSSPRCLRESKAEIGSKGGGRNAAVLNTGSVVANDQLDAREWMEVLHFWAWSLLHLPTRIFPRLSATSRWDLGQLM